MNEIERLLALTEKAVSPFHTAEAVKETLEEKGFDPLCWKEEWNLQKGGKYYTEVDPIYKTASKGKQNWTRTVRDQVPLVQQKNGVSSFIYTEFTVKDVTPNDTKIITQINRFCVYEAFKKLGWLYVPYMPENPGPHPDPKTSIAILNAKLGNTNDDKKRMLFQAMKDMLEYMDEKTSDRQFYFGTDNFDHVWEKLIDRAFGERNKENFFPRSRWLLDYGKYKEKRPLMPDTIMIYKRGRFGLEKVQNSEINVKVVLDMECGNI